MADGVLIALLAGLVTASPGEGSPAPGRPAACEVDRLLATARAGIASGSPAYRRYLGKLLEEAALGWPAATLVDAITRENDPGMLEKLGAALATKASYDEDPLLLQPLLARALRDADPALRAAAVRSLRATGSVEAMKANGDVVTYEQLVQDPSLEVREAVAGNLEAEDAQVYSGHDRLLSETAVHVAASSSDPTVKARILSNVSMEQAGPGEVGEITRELDAPDARVRAAAARALGGAAGENAAASRRALVELYRRETDPEVRKAALASIARLGQSRSIPALQSLRGVAPELDREIESWVSTLELGLQEWHLIAREKQRRSK